MAAGFPVKEDYANGDVLTATNLNDLAGTVNFAVSEYPTTGTQMAGKNKIINGDFGIWQRGTSFAGLTTDVYTADRWLYTPSGATATITRETFTAGTAPETGYEGTYFLKLNVTGADNNWGIYQKVEDVRIAAGQTLTISCYLKSSIALNVYAQVAQEFGSGGSSVVQTTSANQATTTSWARYSFTISVPSISGKTIGTNSNLQIRIRCADTAAESLDFWGFQAELGSVATAFQTATGSVQGELAACQRYYYRNFPPVSLQALGIGYANSTTNARGIIKYPVTMRVRPSALEQSGTATDYQTQSQGTVSTACSAVPTHVGATENEAYVSFTVASGLTAGDGLALRTATTNAFLGWSAEL
jgi:hypothetical protein